MSTIGFHGTKAKNTEKILKEGFNPHVFGSKRLPNDLGEGVYFFIDSEFELSGKEMAKQYIEKFIRNGKDSEDTKLNVLKAVVEDDSSFLIIDLDEDIVEFDKFRMKNAQEIVRKVKFYKSRMGNNKGILKRGNFDGIVTDMFIKFIGKKFLMNTKIDAVQRRTYTDITSYGYKISNNDNGVELCIKNVNAIDNISVVMWFYIDV